MSKQNSNAATLRDNIWHHMALLLAGGILFFTPFFRGLFFTPEQMVVLSLTAVLFFLTWVWKVSRQEVGILTEPMDWLMLIYAAAYAIPLILGPASRNLAAVELAKAIMYFLFFWSVTRLMFDRKKITTLLTVLYYAGVAVALAGLASALGLISIQDGFVGNRIFSVFQYPNTTAAYLLASTFLGIFLYERGSLRLYYGALNTLMMVTFFGTQSRGALLVVPVALLMFAIFLPSRMRISALATFLFSLSAGWFAGVRLAQAGAAGDMGKGFLLLLAAVAISFALELLKKEAEKRKLGERIGRKRLTIGMAVLLVVAVAYMVLGLGALDRIAAVFTPADGQTEAPVVTRDRSALDIGTDSAQSRLYWMGEALQDVFLTSPVFGQGGGSWETSYKAIQDYAYKSTKIHNSWLEILTDTGVLGFGAFLGLWILLAVYSIRNWKNGNPDDRLMQTAVTTAAVALGMHSFIDFNFSLAAFTLFMFTLLAATRSLRVIQTGKGNRFLPAATMKEARVLVLGGVLVISLLAGAIGVVYNLSRTATREAVTALQAGNQELGLERFERAHRLWPFDENVMMDLSTIYLSREEPDRAQQYLDRLSAANPFYARISENRVRLAWSRKDYSGAAEAAREGIRLEPWNTEYYARGAEVNFLSAMLMVQENQDLEGARGLLSETAAYPDRIEEKNREVDRLDVETGLTMGRDNYMYPTPALLLYAGGASYLLQDYDKAYELLSAAEAMEGVPEDIYFWMALIHEARGEYAQYNDYYQRMQTVEEPNPNFTIRSYDYYRDLKL